MDELLEAIWFGGGDDGPSHGPSLILESGSYLVLETGGTFLLED